MRASKRNPLPDAPLELCDPITLPAGEVPGERVLAELDPGHAVLLFDVLRAASIWAADAGEAGWYDPKLLRRWEKAILTGGLDEHLRSAVGVLVGELVHPEAGDPRRLSNCCLSISEWALNRGAVETSIEFNRLAALVWPTNARLAYVTARRYGSVCRFRESDIWLRRAARVARWYSDWEAFADALTSIGMLAYRQGNIPRARTHLDRALRVARRQGLRQLEGEILHDRFTVAFTSNEKTDAEALARAAYERYLPSHDRLPALAYDVAYYWLTRGYAARALRLFEALRPHFAQPEPSFQVLCAAARAAGAAGNETAFRENWVNAHRLIDAVQPSPAFVIALIDLGYGAAHTGAWAQAEAVFLKAQNEAGDRDQEEDRVRAETALRSVRLQENPDPLPLVRPNADSTDFDRVLLSHLSGKLTRRRVVVDAGSTPRRQPEPHVSPKLIPLVELEASSLRELRLHQHPFITQTVETWPELSGILRTAGPSTVVLVNPFAEDETAPARELFTLLADFPSVAVVCAFDVTPARVGDIRQMLQAGVSGFVDLRVDTAAGVVVRHIREAVGRPFKRTVEAITPQHLPADARHIIRAACDAALVGGGVDDVAAMFSVSARTLSLWCQKFRLGSTRSLMVWIRLLLAALLLEDRGRTVESAARAAGYATDRSLRRAFEQTLGTAPSTARREGALTEVSSGFRAWLSEIAAGTRT